MRRLMALSLASGFIAVAALLVWAAEAATIRIVREDVTLVVTFEDRSTIKVTSKPSKINAGEYWVKKYSFFKQDDKKDTWEIRCEKNLGTMKVIMVDPGQDKVVDPGPPLGLRLYVRQGEGENAGVVAISLALLGRYNEVYEPWALQGRRKPRPPVVIIRNHAGEVLQKAVMEVIDDTSCRHEWKIGDYKGNFTLDWEFDLGPFEYEYDTKKQYVIE